MSGDERKLFRRGEEFLALFTRGAEFTKDLLRENERLRHKLERAEQIIDVQKKLCEVLGLPTVEGPPR